MSHDFFETHIDQAPRDEDVREELKDLKSAVEHMDEKDIVDKNISLLQKSPLLCSILPYEKLFAPDAPNAFTVVSGKIDKSFPSKSSFYKHLTILALLCSNDRNKDINDLKLNALDQFPDALKNYLSTSLSVNFPPQGVITLEGVKKILQEKSDQEKKKPHSTLYDQQVYEKLLNGWTEDGRYVINTTSSMVKAIGGYDISYTL